MCGGSVTPRANTHRRKPARPLRRQRDRRGGGRVSPRIGLAHGWYTRIRRNGRALQVPTAAGFEHRLAFAASPDHHQLRPVLLGTNAVLASRVAAGEDELTATGGAAMLDRLLTPLNALGSKRFLREARQKVWHNTLEPQRRARGRATMECRPAGAARDCRSGIRSRIDIHTSRGQPNSPTWPWSGYNFSRRRNHLRTSRHLQTEVEACASWWS